MDSEILSGAGVERLNAELDELAAQRDAVSARIAEIRRLLARSHEAKYEILCRDATATCLWHRRRVTWIPAPGWWIHSDHSTCKGMLECPAPVVITRRAVSRA